jgi:hypothetical protein
VREADETDAAWQTRQRDFGPVKISYDLEKAKWVTANQKYLAVIKNTTEPALVGSILDCDTVIECLERIKSQYTGGGIREHILADKAADKAADNREVHWRWHKRAHTKDEQSGI